MHTRSARRIYKSPPQFDNVSLVLNPSPLLLRGQILSSVHVWVSENTFSAFLIHSPSTSTALPWHYPPRFCSVEHAAGVGWNGMVVPRGKRGDYRLETVTWEVGKGGSEARDGVGDCWRFWLTLQGERRRTENRYAGSTWPREGRARRPSRGSGAGRSRGGQPGGSCWDEQPTSGAT